MLRLETLRPDDLDTTIALHHRHLRLGLFPRLGDEFLREYHAAYVDSPHGVALAARAEGRLVGFLFGTTSNAGHSRWVLRNKGWRLAWKGGCALLVRPQAAWTFATTRAGHYVQALNRHLVPAPSAPRPSRPVAVLSHIVTCDGQRGRGIGRQLVEAFKARAHARGVGRVRLVTPLYGPGPPFFERLGAERVDDRTERDGHPIREYCITLDGEASHEESGEDRWHGGAVRATRRRDGALAAMRPSVGGNLR